MADDPNSASEAREVLRDLASALESTVDDELHRIVMPNTLELSVDKLLWLLFEGHALRVMELTSCVMKELGCADPVALRSARRGALIHDVGKIGVPDRILLKPGRLNAAEWQLMRQHCRWGYQVCLANELLQNDWAIPYCHHEKWDGSGYPRGLRGEEIPLPARAFAPIDVFDALVEDRPYRGALPAPEAWAILEAGRGTHFDPASLDALREAWEVSVRRQTDEPWSRWE